MLLVGVRATGDRGALPPRGAGRRAGGASWRGAAPRERGAPRRARARAGDGRCSRIASIRTTSYGALENDPGGGSRGSTSQAAKAALRVPPAHLGENDGVAVTPHVRREPAGRSVRPQPRSSSRSPARDVRQRRGQPGALDTPRQEAEVGTARRRGRSPRLPRRQNRPPITGIRRDDGPALILREAQIGRTFLSSRASSARSPSTNGSPTRVSPTRRARRAPLRAAPLRRGRRRRGRTASPPASRSSSTTTRPSWRSPASTSRTSSSSPSTAASASGSAPLGARAIAVARRCGRLEWSVLKWNAPAIGFYERLGAVPMEGVANVYRLAGDPLDALAR